MKSKNTLDLINQAKKILVKYLYFFYSLYPIFICINFIRYFGKKYSLYAHIFNSYIGFDTTIRGGCFILNSRIGHHTYISGNFAHLGSSILRNTIIGNYCSIGEDFKSLSFSHDYSCVSTHVDLLSPVYIEPVRIGSDVWIGSGVTVLNNVTIHDGAVVGAGAVVTKDIPPYTIAVGNPAKILKTRFSHKIIKELLAIKWWDNPQYEPILKRNFDDPIGFIKEVNLLKNGKL